MISISAQNLHTDLSRLRFAKYAASYNNALSFAFQRIFSQCDSSEIIDRLQKSASAEKLKNEKGALNYESFLNGDNDAMSELIREFKDGLSLYINSMVRNICEAEELMEETFVELIVKRPKYSGKSSFKTWLYAIGRNLTAKYLRKHAKLKVVPLESQEFLADEEDLERNYIKSEQKQLVHQALRTLKSEYQQVLYLSYFEDFENAEIAKIMKKTKRQVETLLYSAKKALRSELERRGFTYEE